MTGLSQQVRLRRRLRRWHIFFIAFGGVVGVGFFQGSSRTLGMSGPGGALTVTILVGLVAIMVMEAICPLICIWPIPNPLVNFVSAFVDEDLGTAIGVLYWYTYCVTFSYLINTVGTLTDYWGESHLRKTAIYIVAPLILTICNALPVHVFGLIELIGGILKLAIVIGLFILMLLLNFSVGSANERIGSQFIIDGIEFNPNIASSRFAAVCASVPPAIFAYIGVELLTTTAFEARDPREMRLPARNIGWFTTLIYGLTAGAFVSNVYWRDENLPKFFKQALYAATSPDVEWVVPKINENVHAAPLIVLLHQGFRFLPGFINACLIYSALSCANTALYVASRQLYGITRSITVTSDSGFFKKLVGSLGRVEHRTKSPWPAIFVSVVFLYWLPFIKKGKNYDHAQDIQNVLAAAGSVSCILVWCSQCIAYSSFYHWREKHAYEIKASRMYEALFDERNTGWLNVGQPYLSYVGAIATFLIVFFFNTASLWNGHLVELKVISAFASPFILLVIYLLKKFTRPFHQWKLWNDLSRWRDFEARIQYLSDLIIPYEPGAAHESGHESGADVQLLKTYQTSTTTERPSMSDTSNAGDGNITGDPTHSRHNSPTPPEPSWIIGDLQLTSRTGRPVSIADPQVPPEHYQPISPMPAPAPPPPRIDTTNSSSNSTRFYGRATLSPSDATMYSDRPGWTSPTQTYQSYHRPFNSQSALLSQHQRQNSGPPQMLMSTARHELGD